MRGADTLNDGQMTARDVRSGQRLAWGQRALTHIFPAQSGLAVLAVDVSDSMKACQQHPFLGWPAAHVHPVGTWGAVPGRVPPSQSPPLACIQLCLSLASKRRAIITFCWESQHDASSHRSQQRSGTEIREAKYSHRVEEVGTPLASLERLKSGRERGGGQGYGWGAAKKPL